MGSAGVFDTKAVADRRRELFPSEPPTDHGFVRDFERYRSPGQHCGICPKRPDEHCVLSCEGQRATLDDGVTVK